VVLGKGCDQPHVFWPSLSLLFKRIKSSAVVNNLLKCIGCAKYYLDDLFKCVGCAKYYLHDQSMAEEMGVRCAISVQEGLWLFTQPSFIWVCEASSHIQKAFHLEELQLCLVYDPTKIFLTHKFSLLFFQPYHKLKLGLQVGQRLLKQTTWTNHI
jgi:hypothetical protein